MLHLNGLVRSVVGSHTVTENDLVLTNTKATCLHILTSAGAYSELLNFTAHRIIEAPERKLTSLEIEVIIPANERKEPTFIIPPSFMNAFGPATLPEPTAEMSSLASYVEHPEIFHAGRCSLIFCVPNLLEDHTPIVNVRLSSSTVVNEAIEHLAIAIARPAIQQQSFLQRIIMRSLQTKVMDRFHSDLLEVIGNPVSLIPSALHSYPSKLNSFIIQTGSGTAKERIVTVSCNAPTLDKQSVSKSSTNGNIEIKIKYSLLTMRFHFQFDESGVFQWT